LPGDAALGDIDNDGGLDLVDCPIGMGDGEPIVILLNDGFGAFTLLDAGEEPFRAVASRVALHGLNGDGLLDLFLGSFNAPDRIGLNDGTGRCVDSGLRLGGDMMDGIPGVGDLDGDGDPDLFIARYGTEAPNEVWLTRLERSGIDLPLRPGDAHSLR
jgi:hypothetical protein